MTASDSSSAFDAQFSGSIPVLYERLLVPMIFAEPAVRMARDIADAVPAIVLETAAGTGVLTRALAGVCRGSEIVATDLNAAMLEIAQRRQESSNGVRWQQADALDLPFPDRSFDAVACQFGAMFFPDRVQGYAEAARVLRPGQSLWCSVWDRIETNPIAANVLLALRAASPEGTYEFIERTPHGYYDTERIRDDLAHAGLPVVAITTCTGTCTTTAADAAVAYCQGTPIRYEIEADPAMDLSRATACVENALRERFGDGTFAAPTRWLSIRAHG